MTAKKGGAAHPNALHPLFPFVADSADVDLSERDISWIYVFRNGEQAPQKFAAAELQEEEDIFAAFGGGKYTLRARDAAKARWTASRELVLPGAPRPMEGAVAAPPPPVAPLGGVSVDGASGWVKDLVAITAVVAPVVATIYNAAEARAAAQNQLIMNLLARPAQGSSTNDAVMVALVNAATQKNPAGEMMQVMQTALNQGLQLGQLAGQGKEDELGDTMGQVVEAVNAVTEMQKVKNAAAAQGAGAGTNGASS